MYEVCEANKCEVHESMMCKIHKTRMCVVQEDKMCEIHESKMYEVQETKMCEVCETKMCYVRGQTTHRAVHPVASLASSGAPCLIRNLTMFKLPLLAALCSGMCPSESTQSTSAPYLTRASQICRQQAWQCTIELSYNVCKHSRHQTQIVPDVCCR